MTRCEWVDLENRSFGERAGPQCSNTATHVVERLLHGKSFVQRVCQEHVPTVPTKFGRLSIYPIRRHAEHH